jgi:putative chitinase
MVAPLDRAALQRLAPRPRSAAKAEIWDGYVSALEAMDPACFIAAGITTRSRLVHVLSQWAWESGGFTILWESDAYSARRIVEVFGPGHHSARIGADEARELAGDGPALFERAYGTGNPRKARELGNTEPGDGYKYRGFGIEQITGRADHERLLKGEYTYASAIRAALAEWREKNCNAAADRDDCRRVTKLINGGSEGLDQIQ